MSVGWLVTVFWLFYILTAPTQAQTNPFEVLLIFSESHIIHSEAVTTHSRARVISSEALTTPSEALPHTL